MHPVSVIFKFVDEIIDTILFMIFISFRDFNNKKKKQLLTEDALLRPGRS